MASRCLALLLAAALLCSVSAVTPPEPSSCDSSSDIYNLNVNLTTLLTGYEALANSGVDAGIDGTCLTNALTQLASCQTDLNKISGCCTQSCYDALRMPEIANGCLYSVIQGTCAIAANSSNTDSMGAMGLLAPLFFTYSNCVNLTRVPYTCASFGSDAMVGMNFTWNQTVPGNFTIPAYGGVGYGGNSTGGDVAYAGTYGGMGYGGGLGYGGVGYGSAGYGGVGFGGYGGVAYGGYGGFIYGGVGYGGIGYGGPGYPGMGMGAPARRLVARRLSAGRKSSALASVLRKLKKNH